jgi:uncharacterized protein YjbI with pentapeptide repeats
MADKEQLRILKQGPEAWNEWRSLNPGPEVWNAWHLSRKVTHIDLSGANLRRADLRRVDLRHARLLNADLRGADLYQANLSGADLRRANLSRADLGSINIATDPTEDRWVHDDLLMDARTRIDVSTNLISAKLSGANFSGAELVGADLREADLTEANLSRANLSGVNLSWANLREADLTDKANLSGANLSRANLSGADLREADLTEANLSTADLSGADLTGAYIFGVSAWGLKLESTKQQNLVITRPGEPEITIDNIEVAQFIYLLLHNEKIRNVIDTVGRKGVLLLGRFTEKRIAVLERLREELRKRGYLPIVFNFDKPETKDFTETVRLLAGLAHFVIADITNPKSAPLELQATVPEIMVPFRPIIEEGQEPFAMLKDLWVKHRDWVFEPIYYSSLDALVGALDEKIIGPAKVRFAELLARKAEEMKGEHV